MSIYGSQPEECDPRQKSQNCPPEYVRGKSGLNSSLQVSLKGIGNCSDCQKHICTTEHNHVCVSRQNKRWSRAAMILDTQCHVRQAEVQ